jgi:hypothetical protein
MGRSRHKVKEIENTVQELEGLGWVWIKGKGHAWGVLRCPKNSKDCRCGVFCLMSVWSTPQNPEKFAKRLRQKALACVKLDDENGDDNG